MYTLEPYSPIYLYTAYNPTSPLFSIFRYFRRNDVDYLKSYVFKKEMFYLFPLFNIALSFELSENVGGSSLLGEK